MYHESGDFGLVRMVTLLPTPQSRSLFSLHTIGWHRCNDLYRITRPNGCETHLVLITTKGRGVLLLEGRRALPKSRTGSGTAAQAASSARSSAHTV